MFRASASTTQCNAVQSDNQQVVESGQAQTEEAAQTALAAEDDRFTAGSQFHNIKEEQDATTHTIRVQQHQQQQRQHGSSNSMNKRWTLFGGSANTTRSNAVQSFDEPLVENGPAQAEDAAQASDDEDEEDDWFNAESQFHKKKEEVLVTVQDATTHTIRVSRVPTEEFQQRLARASLKY